MPAPTNDPISSVLQRTFGGLEHKKEGLIRGGNSASAKSFNILDKKLQAASKSSSGIQFDEPTQYSSGSGLRQQMNGGNTNGTNSCTPKVIVLNPQYLPRAVDNNSSERTNGSSQNDPSKVALPKPKVIFYPLSKVDVGYTKMRPPGAGMANVGNTCYLNSTLQALFHTPALFNYLINNCGSHHMTKCSSSSIANGFLQSCTVCALVHTLKDTLRLNVIRPNRIYEKLKIICKHMVQGRQEDAHEFLRYLIESLQRSYLNTIPGSKSLDAASKETTPFNQIFGGYMRQDVTCLRCKYVSTTFQHFMDILVDIRQASNIEEALQVFFRQEKLGNAGDEASMYKCEKCKVKVPAKKRCFLEKPPAVLCIQLKRFSLMGGKIGKPVQLSRMLNIAPFIYPNRIGGTQFEQVQYKLVSMITHVGPTPNCGHYTAIGEAANGQFYQFDDASVRPIPLSQVLNTASYVVFYEMTRSSWANVVASNASENNGVARPISSNTSTPSASATSASSSSSYGDRFIGPQKPPSLNRITAEATSLIKPRIIGANGVVNKLGVVSSAAKSMANVVADVAKTVVSSTPLTNKSSEPQASPVLPERKFSSKGLVPYDDDEESSDEDGSKTASSINFKNEQQQASPKPQFVPRAITVKKLNEKTTTPALAQSTTSSSSSPIKATKKNWTVTDVDHHNPSVHSDNSTGSTNGGWKVTSQTPRPSSAMSDDSSKTENKWTVTPLQRAIEEESTSSIANNQNAYLTSGPSTPTSSTSTSSSTISSASEKKRKFSSEERLARKRPSIDENVENDNDYDAELDRGRTKKVKRIEPPSNHRQRDSSCGNGSNPFQIHQDRANQYQRNHSSSSRSMSSPSYRQHHRSNNHWARDYYRNNDYHTNRHSNHRDSFRGRRQSYGGNDNRDKSHQHSHHKVFNRSFSYNSNHHRDNYRHSGGGGGRDSFGRRPSFKSS